MTRFSGKAADRTSLRINRTSVKEFFKLRAEKSAQLGYIQAVIYQDKNPELALARDLAEKSKLLPLLCLQGPESVLDVGCGTGRWADEILPRCLSYVGVDLSRELIAIAASRFASQSKANFICMPAESVSIDNLGKCFDIILSAGLFIYLNDDELLTTLRGYASVAKEGCRIIVREPVGMVDRLTIVEHYSEDLDQVYNAVYRTEEELREFMGQTLFREGFEVIGAGDVYDSSLNNRSDTKQRWLMLER
jgi:SAM-dependent methyltransferase